MDERRLRRVLAGDYAGAGLPHPVSGPSVYRRIAHLTLDAHGLDGLGDPEQLARAEGLRVVWRGASRGCGVHMRGGVVVRWDGCTRQRGLVLTHERSHRALRVFGAPHANETDAVLLTVELALPWASRARWDSAMWVPEWLLSMRTMRKAA